MEVSATQFSSTLPQFERDSLSGLVPSGLVVAGAVIDDPARDMVSARVTMPAEIRCAGAGGIDFRGTMVRNVRDASFRFSSHVASLARFAVLPRHSSMALALYSTHERTTLTSCLIS